MLLYSSGSATPAAAPPATEVVNAGITLFSRALPLQSARIQESSLEQLTTLLQASTRLREPAKRAAAGLNVASALLYTVMVANKETSSASGNLSTQAVQKLIQEILRVMK